MDIVERLRQYECANCGWEGAVIKDAADEIERLRERTYILTLLVDAREDWEA